MHGWPGLGVRRGRLRGMDAGLRVQQGGSGEPTLLLLHGLGATGDVWDGWRTLLARRWPGRWLAPDLPGHGGSPSLSSYTFDTLAAETQEELDRAQVASHRPSAWFSSRDEAAARYLRISGLACLLAADAPAVDAGLREEHGRWRLAMDPGAFAVGAPDMAQFHHLGLGLRHERTAVPLRLGALTLQTERVPPEITNLGRTLLASKQPTIGCRGGCSRIPEPVCAAD